MDQIKKLSLVLVHWRAEKDLQTNLAQIATWQTLNPQIIVVANESLNLDLPKGSQSIVNLRNEGFAFAANQGLAQVETPFVLFLNPDCLLSEQAVLNLLNHLEATPNMAMVGPQLRNSKGRPVAACRRSFGLFSQQIGHHFPFLTPAFWGWKRTEYFQANDSAPCIQGSAMLCRTDVLRSIGGFDPSVPLYLDDMDLCRRLTKAGWLVGYAGEVIGFHSGGSAVAFWANPKLTSLIAYLAHDIYFLKHHTWIHVLFHHLLLLFASVVYLPIDVVLYVFWPRKREQWLQYAIKHREMLRFALLFRFKAEQFPKHWPKSLRAARLQAARILKESKEFDQDNQLL